MRLLLLTLAVLVTASPVAAQYEASLVADIHPGPEGGITPAIHDRDTFSPTVYAGKLFFAASDGQTGRELWFHDATTGETTLAADIVPGPDSSSPTDLAVYDGRLFFAASTEEIGRELWAYDAATGEATLAADLNPDSGVGSDPQYLTVYDERLFFNAVDFDIGSRLWAYDAATEQATEIGDITPGTWFYPFHLTPYDDRLFFSAEDYGNDIGRELWVYDASTDEITLAADLLPGPVRSLGDDLHDAPAVYDNRLFLVTYSGTDLWAYDASKEEATPVTDASGSWLTAYDERLFFRSDGLWAYDSATDDAALVDGSVAPRFTTVFDGKLFFNSGGEVWTFEAGAEISRLAADINPERSASPQGFTVYDGRLFFSADDGAHGRELWVLTPTAVANEPSVTPKSVHLHAPHPNPLRGQATITFEVADAKDVSIEVLDVLGRPVARLTDGPVPAGEHTLRWEPDGLPSGVYVVRLTSDGTVQTQRLTLVR